MRESRRSAEKAQTDGPSLPPVTGYEPEYGIEKVSRRRIILYASPTIVKSSNASWGDKCRPYRGDRGKPARIAAVVHRRPGGAARKSASHGALGARSAPDRHPVFGGPDGFLRARNGDASQKMAALFRHNTARLLGLSTG